MTNIFRVLLDILYPHHHNHLLFTNRFWRRMDRTKLLENKEMVFKNVVINIQAAGYNEMHTVYKIVAPWEQIKSYWMKKTWINQST